MSVIIDDETARISAAIDKDEALTALAQCRKDWDAMLACVARSLGTDEDRDAVDMDPDFFNEFDPWNAIRNAGALISQIRSDAHLAREAMAAVQEDLRKAEKRIAEAVETANDFNQQRIAATRMWELATERSAEFKSRLEAALADASRLRTENEAMRAVVRAAKEMPDRLLPLPGDWACRECRPESDILVDGFQCQTHALKAALAALASKNGDGE